MSKNKSGIDNFFTNQKLFKQTNNKLTTNKISTSNISGRSTTKGYHYHLLNKSVDQLQKQQNGQQQQVQYQRGRNISQVNVNNNDNNQQDNRYTKNNQDRNYNTISRKAQQAQSRMVYSRNQQKSKQKQKKNYPYTTYRNQSANDQGYQQPIQQQSPTGWQSLIIKSSRKYFDSCRSQANNYIQKLQKMLGKDSKLIKSTLNKINNSIQQFYTQQCNKIKQHLYILIDQILQKSKKNILQSFMQQQINYVGQLLQLNTQIQQRYKQINIYKIQLDSEKDWKNCVSQLLINNQQDNLLHLSKLCKNSIDNVEKNVQQYCNKINKQIQYKLRNKINQEDITAKIDRINNKNAKQRIDTMKSAIRSSVTPIKNNMGEVSTGNKYTGSGKKSQVGAFTNSNKWQYTDKYYGEGTNDKLNDSDNKQQARFDKNYQQIQAKPGTSGKYEQL